MNSPSLILSLFCLAITPSPALNAEPEPLEVVSARASSVYGDYDAALAVDGEISDPSRWVAERDAEGRIWLELTLAERQEIAGLHVFSGYGDEDPISSFLLQFRDASGNWVSIPSARVSSNPLTALRIPFDTTVDVVTDRLRLHVIKTPDDIARVKEIRVWPAGPGGVPELKPDEVHPGTVLESDIPEIYLNQSGFNSGRPKRFTAPTLPDGTAFSIHPESGGDPVFTGSITDHLGDFSAFEPNDRREYVVKAGGHTSVPFTVGLWQLERITYRNAVDFMIDSRHYVGNVTEKRRRSYAWRDDHHFAWVLRTLVPQYLSNPAAYGRMPKRVSYVSPEPGLWGALDPYDERAPDMVKLIHWAADVTLTQQLTHEFLKGELAYFLYAWPVLKEWFPQQNYDAVLAYVQANWEAAEADQEYPYDTSPEEHDLFALKTHVGSNKGEYPPGHSLMPNLLMHQVAVRDGLPDADRYFEVAYRQAEWIIRELDWENPLTTKGQRMSEHITMTGLAAFLRMYPERAPGGLREKIERWADIMIRRSENMWDFRKLTDGDQWTPSGEKRTMWNEPGNVVGFPAAVLAARPFIEDGAERERLTELVWSHFDNAFGRNPTGRHFSYDAPREIEGVEYGWYSYYDGGIGQLKDVPFVLDGAPKHVHYPYHPERGNYGWTEGWVQFNTAYNLSLAYLARAHTELSLEQDGGDLIVRLRAPLNFDATREEPVTLTIGGPRRAELTLTETAPESPEHSGRIALDQLGAGAGDTISVTYGFGYMGTHASLTVQ
jgi:hypothetical protein